MTAMTIGAPEPLMPLLREWTVADLETLPDDGLQYELLDGLLLVSQDSGVASYWVVDPDSPSLTAFDLIDGHYQPVAAATGSQVADLKQPFPLRIMPAELLNR